MKRWAIPAIVMALLFADVSSALACSPPPTIIRVRCSNAEYSFTPTSEMTTRDPRHPAAAAECAESLSTLTPQLDQAVEVWRNNGYNYRFVGGNELAFEPYTVEREQALLKAQGNLPNCTYPVYDRLGDWLKIWTASRDYCTAPVTISLSSCGSLNLKLSLVLFIGHLIQHPNQDTAPYLSLLLLIVGPVIVALGYKARMGKFIATLKPSLGKIAFSLIVGVMIFCAGGFLDTLLFMGLVYLVVSFLLPIVVQELPA